jgi:hypothetical protein
MTKSILIITSHIPDARKCIVPEIDEILAENDSRVLCYNPKNPDTGH